MDDIVRQAIAKWPNVPNCYGWLGLDARGNWYMRDDQAQAAGPFAGGSLVARSVRGTTILAALLIASVLLLAGLGGDGIAAGGAGLWLGGAVVVVWGVGFGLIPVALTSWMLEAVPDAPEAGQALLVSGFQVAIALGAALGGIAVDRHGVTSAILLGGAGTLAAALVVATLGNARRKRPLLEPRVPMPLP